MPETAAFIDACRDVFGADEINASIKAGLQGKPTFYASENGQTVGTPAIVPRFSISAADIDLPVIRCDGCAWLLIKPVSPDGKREVRYCRKFKTIAERKCADWSAR